MLDGVTPGMAIEREETFGPVVPVVEVTSAAQALELTNASPFGLTAAVFTSDLDRGLAFAERARAGWVNINASTNLWESHLPFGGRAGSVSGRGRVGGRYPMDTFTEPKTVTYLAPRVAFLKRVGVDYHADVLVPPPCSLEGQVAHFAAPLQSRVARRTSNSGAGSP